MSISPRVRPGVPGFVGILNPIARRLLAAGIPLGPNGLLTVRGRKTGVPRTVPVAFVHIGDRRWLSGTFGNVDWVRNLRAAGRGTITVRGRREEVRAIELGPDEAVAFFSDVLGPYARRLPLGRWLLSVLGAGELLGDPETAARNHPVFELVPASPA
jgi:deazaflavin-dependent oxidoreductase (nitroreductase family)